MLPLSQGSRVSNLARLEFFQFNYSAESFVCVPIVDSGIELKQLQAPSQARSIAQIAAAIITPSSTSVVFNERFRRIHSLC